MMMKEVIENLVHDFGPPGVDRSVLVATITKIMPTKDVPTDTYNKIVRIVNALKGAGVPQ